MLQDVITGKAQRFPFEIQKGGAQVMDVLLMSTGFAPAHLEAWTPCYDQASQHCLAAGSTKGQQDAHTHKGHSPSSACLKLYVVTLLW